MVFIKFRTYEKFLSQIYQVKAEVASFLKTSRTSLLWPILLLFFEGPAWAETAVDIRYSQNFSVGKKDSLSLVTLLNPWSGATVTFHYLLKPRASATSDHRILLPFCAGCGALVVLIAVLLAQLLGHATGSTLKAVTALIGSPVIIWFILRRQKLQKSFFKWQGQ